MAKHKRRPAASSQSHKIRIISGTWRGRTLPVLEVQGLRPTASRLRETLFNWLQNTLPGAVCLDAFAGTGALGFEAASRGAGKVVMLDSHAAVVQHLQQHQSTLSAEQVTIQQADASHYLQQAEEGFDVVFLDPPFQANLLPQCCALLQQRKLLKPHAWLYLEMDKQQKLEQLNLPEHWHLHREHHSQHVNAYLLQVQTVPDA